MQLPTMERRAAEALRPAPDRMVIAALLDPLVNLCTDFIGSVGYAGVFVLTMLGSACIPIPSEATMLFAGFKVSDGDLTLLGVILAGVTGELLGCLIAYAAGYYGRIDLLERNKLIHIDRKRLDWVDSWFTRHGDVTVFLGRLIPLVRAFISLPAGVAEMPLRRFIPLTLAGSAIWLSGLVLVGRAVGDNWDEWHQRLAFLDYVVVAAAIAAIAYLVIQRRRGGPRPDNARARESATRDGSEGESTAGMRGGPAGVAEEPPVS
jgi:membrane protein DedA with SNARE-associated domain